MKRLVILGLISCALVATLVVFNPLALLPSAEVEPGPAPRDTAQVTTQDLTSTFEGSDGNLLFDGEYAVADPQAGTIGWIVEPESLVVAGDVLYERDQQPVVLLAGATPAWRTMTVDDVGTDVAQLESNLLALGYGNESEFTVDDTFTSATAAIVARWQEDLGVDETGTVALGDVVFAPDTARIGSVSASIGDASDQSTLLTLSGQDRKIVFSVTAETIAFVSPGTSIEARLPDRQSIVATVTDVAPAGSGVSLVTATIDSDSEATLPLGDSIPVTVTWSDVVAADSVTVPAGALMRLDNGSYAVEVVDQRGGTELTLVEVGERFGTHVQILGGLEPGTSVIAP